MTEKDIAIALITGVTVTVVILVTVLAILARLEKTFRKKTETRHTPGVAARTPPPPTQEN